jgi:4-hydroxy-3-polyprenylbenzoate decarboxylase
MPAYTSTEDCLNDLEKAGQLLRITEEVDPYLEMANIHLRVHAAQGPAILFENVKGCNYRAASNLFGTLERSEFIFRDSLQKVQELIALKNNPLAALKKPFKHFTTGIAALNALPKRNPWQKPVMDSKIKLSEVPNITHWPMDGGAFVTLPLVYSEDVEQPGIMQANLGMYRIQISGNDYKQDQECGLHYQLHRGIGIHQTKANKKNQPLKVSCFVGGPPAHTVAAVMPLPEGMSEMTFAGVLGGRRFRYSYENGFAISTDADFVITGEVHPLENKAEGPFGDHLGYYSLQHSFPLMRVQQVYARKNAIWPFTVVGRPPQEDTSFGKLIHAITGDAIQAELPGVQEVHAVDAAGVHPLLLAIGSERYTPYTPTQQPAELLTQANHILGKGQLSLAKFLIITASNNDKKLSAHNILEFFTHVLERINLQRDVHFYTKTTIDTLDYSGEGLNEGSKVVLAAYGNPMRTLSNNTDELSDLKNKYKISCPLPGVLALTLTFSQNITDAQAVLSNYNLQGFPLIVIADDANFVAESNNNFLWVTFTRCNPSHDFYGLNETYVNKHWGCDNLIIDARKKPHHAPELVLDETVNKRVSNLFSKMKLPY